jgi:hypothetical protein
MKNIEDVGDAYRVLVGIEHRAWMLTRVCIALLPVIALGLYLDLLNGRSWWPVIGIVIGLAAFGLGLRWACRRAFGTIWSHLHKINTDPTYHYRSDLR